MPRNRKVWREIFCPDCDHRWFAKVSKKRPFSKCKGCGEEREAVPVEEGQLVGVAHFKCKMKLCANMYCTNKLYDIEQCKDRCCGTEYCHHEYVVICRGMDTAKCYKCFKPVIDNHCELDNPHPIRVTPGTMKKKTAKKHSCSRCKNGKLFPCLNKQEHNSHVRRPRSDP